MKKIFLVISIFVMMPLMASQSQESMWNWNRFAPAAIALKKSFVNSFTNPFKFEVLAANIQKRNPFIANFAGWKRIVPTVTAESSKLSNFNQGMKKESDKILSDAIKALDVQRVAFALKYFAEISDEDNATLDAGLIKCSDFNKGIRPGPDQCKSILAIKAMVMASESNALITAFKNYDVTRFERALNHGTFVSSEVEEMLTDKINKYEQMSYIMRWWNKNQAQNLYKMHELIKKNK